MKVILLFAPYFLVPLIVALLFKWCKFSLQGLSYLLTLILVIPFSLGLSWIENYLNPPQAALKCDNDNSELILILFLPIALMLQYIFNRVFCKARNQ